MTSMAAASHTAVTFTHQPTQCVVSNAAITGPAILPLSETSCRFSVPLAHSGEGVPTTRPYSWCIV